MAQNDVRKNEKCVVIGGSAGSLKVLLHLIPKLDAAINVPIVIIVHRKNDAQSSLETLLGDHSKIKVKEAEDKEALLPGVVYIAPPNYHLLIEKEQTLSLDCSEKVQFSRPSIDVSFQSAAEVFGNGLLGIILSGANNDGTAGLATIQECGGLVAIQNPRNADMPTMPISALEELDPDYIVNDSQIADIINIFASA